MKKLVILVLLLCWKISALAAFPALEYSVPFDLGGYTYTDYVILKIEDTNAADYAVVYYANHQSAYSTTECNKDLSCAQSACYGAFGYASYPDNRGTSGYLLQYNDWCGYIPHFSRKHDKTTGVWSDSGFENQNETLRVDPTLPLSQSTITTFPLSLFNYHPANDDFLGDYGLDVVTFGMVVLEANVPIFRNAVGSFRASVDDTGGQCVPYVRYETDVPIYGDAYTWYQQAVDTGYATSSSVPRVSSIIVFAAQAGMLVGHVGIVTAVNGNNITIRDSNWGLDEKVAEHTVDVSNYTITGYIYYTP